MACKIAHGLAYAVYGRQYAAKQINNLRLTDTARAINSQNRERARDVLRTTLNNVMAIASKELGQGHDATGSHCNWLCCLFPHLTAGGSER